MASEKRKDLSESACSTTDSMSDFSDQESEVSKITLEEFVSSVSLSRGDQDLTAKMARPTLVVYSLDTSSKRDIRLLLLPPCCPSIKPGTHQFLRALQHRILEFSLRDQDVMIRIFEALMNKGRQSLTPPMESEMAGGAFDHDSRANALSDLLEHLFTPSLESEGLWHRYGVSQQSAFLIPTFFTPGEANLYTIVL